MNAPLDRVLDRLDGVVAQNGHHMALCPAHADRNPSLKIDVNRNGDVLLHCFAGCMTQDVLAALDLTFRDLSPEPRQPPPPTPKRIVKTTNYPIHGRHGEYRSSHRRVDYDDGSKDVTWPPGTRPKELPLYGIHTRRDDHERVIVVEGEKARDALDAVTPHDCLVVGTVCGAGATPNLDVLSDLAGLDVILWPDNDAAGRKHMERIAARLDRDAQWISWPAAPPKGDAADWVATGGTDPFAAGSGLSFLSSISPILGLVGVEESNNEENCQPEGFDPFQPVAEFMSDGSDEVPWIARPWVAAGSVTLLSGKPKMAGKTTFTLHLIAAILNGDSFIGEPTQKGPVLLVSEQGGVSLKQALDRAGVVDHPDFQIAIFRQFYGKTWAELVEAAFTKAERLGARLLVIDTLTACAQVKEENDAGQARDVISQLKVHADRTGVAVLVTFHEGKGEHPQGEAYRGSSAYAGEVDINLHIERIGGDNADAINRRLITIGGRFDDDVPEKMYVQLTDHQGYIGLGDERAIVARSVRATLGAVLPTAGAGLPLQDIRRGGELIEEGLLTKVKAAGVHVGHNWLKQSLDEGVRLKAIGFSGLGKRHHPFRYWLQQPDHPFFSEEPESFLSSTLGSLGETGPEETLEETLTPEQAAMFWA